MAQREQTINLNPSWPSIHPLHCMLANLDGPQCDCMAMATRPIRVIAPSNWMDAATDRPTDRRRVATGHSGQVCPVSACDNWTLNQDTSNYHVDDTTTAAATTTTSSSMSNEAVKWANFFVSKLIQTRNFKQVHCVQRNAKWCG